MNGILCQRLRMALPTARPLHGLDGLGLLQPLSLVMLDQRLN